MKTASEDFLVKVYNNGAWAYKGIGGQKGTQATIPFAFTPRQGTRLSLLIETVEANRRFQVEGIAFPVGE